MRPNWITNGPRPEWLEDDVSFTSLVVAWESVDAEAKRVSPRMDEQQRRALRQVFNAGAHSALGVLFNCPSHVVFEMRMSSRWKEFAAAFVHPNIHPRQMPLFAPSEIIEADMAKIVAHQHGYYEAGGRAAILCVRNGAIVNDLTNELNDSFKSVMERRKSCL